VIFPIIFLVHIAVYFAVFISVHRRVRDEMLAFSAMSFAMSVVIPITMWLI